MPPREVRAISRGGAAAGLTATRPPRVAVLAEALSGLAFGALLVGPFGRPVWQRRTNAPL